MNSFFFFYRIFIDYSCSKQIRLIQFIKPSMLSNLYGTVSRLSNGMGTFLGNVITDRFKMSTKWKEFCILNLIEDKWSFFPITLIKVWVFRSVFFVQNVEFSHHQQITFSLTRFCAIETIPWSLCCWSYRHVYKSSVSFWRSNLKGKNTPLGECSQKH